MPMSLRRFLPATFVSLTVNAILNSTAIAAGLGFAPGPAGWDYYSYQNILIGATLPLQQSANYGQGVTIATIDTGITKDWVGFGGLNVSSYKCLNNTCSTAANNSDDNGHGTFVASEIVGGVQFGNGNGMLGVSPFSNLVAVKVLDAQGSGSSNDTANGIKFAVDHGAKIINLSLGPSGSPAQQVAFYNSLASAINYAASKNAVIVFAGGNTGTVFAGGAFVGSSSPKAGVPNLFTDEALQHMMFIGATDSKKLKAWYSSHPGTAGFYSASGKFYAYSNMWLMADGGSFSMGNCIDCIVGAPNVANANYLALEAGTSMAAPQAAGAAALLAARWPVLLTNGTIAAILEKTATDLGADGIDRLYGSGFINLAQAFQPVGNLSVIMKNGVPTPVTSVTSSVLSSSAMGSMSKLSNALSNYTAFDSYQRDFNVNLSGLVTGRSSSSPAGQSIGAPKITSGVTHFSNGSNLAFGNMESDAHAIDRPAGTDDHKNWFMSFTDASGSTIAAGSGFSASASFADAMWGSDSQISQASYSLGVSDALMRIATGGNYLTYGDKLGKDTRIAFSWTQSAANAITGGSSSDSDWTRPDATSFSTALNTDMTESWKAGITFGILDEQSGMLGSAYAPNGPLNFGSSHRSMSFGLTSAFSLGEKSDLVIDAAMARTGGSEGGGLITGVSSLYASTFGAAFVQHDSLAKGDHLSFSMRSPLRVISGSASLATTTVDGNGVATTGSQRVSLTPSGHEMDFSMGYTAPVSERVSMSASLNARRNADNMQGAHDADFLVGTKITF